MFEILSAELQKEEEEDDQRCVTDGPSLPPASTFSPDPSHPYYDVARHGIIQVSGQYAHLFLILSDFEMKIQNSFSS